MSKEKLRQVRLKRRREQKFEVLRQNMSGLPDDIVPAIIEARSRLGIRGREPRNMHGSIMANFNIIFKKLGIEEVRRNGKKATTRKPRTSWHKVISPDFTQSYEWRKLRYRVLQKYGRRCMCCGRTPEDGVKIHVDHIKPRRRFPDLAFDEDNLQVLCDECNHGKGNWDMTDWRPALGDTR